MASVDIVIPNYNYGRFLPDCVASVLNNDLPDVRVTIIDNASTDDSAAICRRLAAADARIRLVQHESNLGSHASFNRGIDLASADYFMVLCADDLLLPGALSEGIMALERAPRAAFAIGAHAQLDGAAPRRQGWHVAEGTQFIDACGRSIGQGLTAQVIVRTGTQKAVGHYRPSLKYMDDLEMVLRLARHGAVVRVVAPLVFARRHESHMSKVFWYDRLSDLREREAVFDSFFAHEGAGMPGAARRQGRVRRRLAEASYWSAASHVFRGRPKQALELFRFGLRLCPSAMIVPPLGHLVRMEGASSRLRAVAGEAFGMGRRSEQSP